MAALDLNLGPILLGTVLNVWLYGIMVTQTTVYFVTFQRDHKWLKMLVAWLFTIDTLNTAFDIGLVWRYTITLFGDTEAIVRSHWLFNVEPVMTTMISSTTQSFFAWRIARLTGQTWLGYLIGLSAFIQLAAGLGSTIGASIVRDFDRFQELKAAVITWLGLSAVTDVAITCALSCTHIAPGFLKPTTLLPDWCDHFIVTVQTGFITTVWATTDLILYLALPNNLHLFFQLPLCKLYTNSLMSTLNSRNGWGGSFASGEDPSARSGGQTGRDHAQNKQNTAAVWRPDQTKSQTHTAIQVMTTATVHRDDGFELEEYEGDSKQLGNDVENFPGRGTTVQLPNARSKTAISDENSMHSRLSFDPK